jgi:hypothetical protein
LGNCEYFDNVKLQFDSKLSNFVLKLCICNTAADNAEMLILYGECGRKAREDAREYAIRFPHPNYNVFLRLVNRARDIGSLVPT